MSKSIDKAKLRKSFLDMPNEALKNEQAKILLHKFFNICFKNGLCPTEWYDTRIKPIRKPDKDLTIGAFLLFVALQKFTLLLLMNEYLNI